MIERPPYANFDSPAKFEAIQGIIAQRQLEHPSAICSYSGGGDSDILIDLIERVRAAVNLPPVPYVFYNTGLEMRATKEHVKETAQKYGVQIQEVRPEMSIVETARKFGLPFLTKYVSDNLESWQRKGIPLSIIDEVESAEDKTAKILEQRARYPKSNSLIGWLCSYSLDGHYYGNSQFGFSGVPFLREFQETYPPDFQISAQCCRVCKKRPAHKTQKNYEMVVTGERYAEGGARMLSASMGCFGKVQTGQYRFRPLYWVSNQDKAWYKERYNIRYSDAYEIYGLKRTGCCGCPIASKCVEELESIRPYEPNLVKAAWNVFGKSYDYRLKYNEFRKAKREEAKRDEAKREEANRE